jgi:hypothetical protein
VADCEYGKLLKTVIIVLGTRKVVKDGVGVAVVSVREDGIVCAGLGNEKLPERESVVDKVVGPADPLTAVAVSDGVVVLPNNVVELSVELHRDELVDEAVHDRLFGCDVEAEAEVKLLRDDGDVRLVALLEGFGAELEDLEEVAKLSTEVKAVVSDAGVERKVVGGLVRLMLSAAEPLWVEDQKTLGLAALDDEDGDDGSDFDGELFVRRPVELEAAGISENEGASGIENASVGVGVGLLPPPVLLPPIPRMGLSG